MKNYAKEFRDDILKFKDATEKFYRKELTTAQYKGISGGFGSYAQRGGACGMLRLRLCGGRITKDNLAFITDSIEKYQIDRIHMTTCQTVQLHNLKPDDIYHLAKDAWEHGIITRGGGGDFPRNVMMSPLAGVMADEPFDVSPYAKAAEEYLLGCIKAVKLPRKLKVCFSSSKENFPHATFRDLGFVAKENRAFDVYAAGGLGKEPKMGLLAAKDIAPEKILYAIKAMIEVFTEHGNYENRAKSRTRFLQDTMGQDGFLQAFSEKLSAALSSGGLDISVKEPALSKQGDGSLSHPRAIAQKQPGLYAVSYHPIGGSPSPDTFQKLQKAIAPMEGVELRLSPDEGMYLINCTAKEAKALIDLTDDGAETLFETSVACIGNSICQIGLRDSQALLNACIEAVRPCRFADGVLPKLHISGCLSSCGAHQTAALGFRGAVKQSPDGPLAAFALFEGGNGIQGEERFGNELCVITVENIPKFLVALGQAVTDAHMVYEDWIQGHHDALVALAQQYAA